MKQSLKKPSWKRTIIAAMKEAGTFQPAFDSVIESLATILSQRDSAYNEFIEAGGQACIQKISDRGSVNIAKNPRLLVWNDLNNTALAYWRECGLSPASLKKISSEIMTEKTGDVIEALLEKITSDE